MIAAVVLAAGASTRMGAPKRSLLVREGGPTFLQAIDASLRAAGVGCVRVVVPPGVPLAPDHVANPAPERGMLSSVQCGLGALPRGVEAVLLWPVDHPLVTATTIATLLETWRAHRAAIVVPVFEGRRGHPALFDAAVVPELLAADPAVGARGVVHAHPDRCEVAVDDVGVVTGIDTPDDYRRALGLERPAPHEAA